MLRKNATVKVLDILVPVMAVLYFVITLIIIGMNITALPGVFQRIFEEAFGIRQFWRYFDEWCKTRLVFQ